MSAEESVAGDRMRIEHGPGDARRAQPGQGVTATRTSTTAAIGALLTATLFWAGNHVVGGAPAYCSRPCSG
ncbi:hypothetical protein ACFV30_27075 [Streptomyces sp. NPDC059752]|uniref:hypothetical protein n=1 Tax=unclassified Streptomyces TaxID=2593676 RepID=UPI003666F7EC